MQAQTAFEALTVTHSELLEMQDAGVFRVKVLR